MILCDVVRAVLWALVPLTWWVFGQPVLWLLFAVAVFGAITGNAFQVACITAVPNLVGRRQLVLANSRLHSTYAVMYLLGQSVSAAVCACFGPLLSLGVNAGSFLLSAASLGNIRLVRSSTESSAVDAPDAGRIDDHLAGARFLARQPLLRAIALVLAGSSL